MVVEARGHLVGAGKHGGSRTALTTGMNLTKFLSGLAIAVVMASIVVNIKDVGRYIRISTM